MEKFQYNNFNFLIFYFILHSADSFFYYSPYFVKKNITVRAYTTYTFKGVWHILKQDFFRNLEHCEICIPIYNNTYSIVTSENPHVSHQFCAPNVCTFYVYFIFVHEMSTLFLSFLFLCTKCSTLFLCTKCLHFLYLLYFCAPNIRTFCIYFIFVH